MEVRLLSHAPMKLTLNKSEFRDDRATEIVRTIRPFLIPNSKLIDIGAGGCTIAQELIREGFQITPIDVRNKSVVSDISPTIYDGKRIPFADSSFDIALLITVLHHTKDPVAILKEASRVAKRIIVMEDLYENQIQKYLTFIMDSWLNKEFFGHPYSNKTETDWEQTFKNLDLKLIGKEKHPFWRFFLSGTFCLEK